MSAAARMTRPARVAIATTLRAVEAEHQPADDDPGGAGHEVDPPRQAPRGFCHIQCGHTSNMRHSRRSRGGTAASGGPSSLGDVKTTQVNRTVDAVWRMESARLIAGLTRMTRDVGLAEELAQDALVAALEQWPESGVPDNPGAWLMSVSKRRAIDLFRRNERLSQKINELGHDLQVREERRPTPARSDDFIEDDLLRLIFVTCHPVLPTDGPGRADAAPASAGSPPTRSRRAFLVPESTVAQRIVRAKRTLAEASASRSRRRSPTSGPARLASVLEVVYLIFNEGYSATAGDDWMRPALCEDALRLGRVLADAGAARARGARPGRADGDPGVPAAGPHRPGRRAGPAARPEPRALGPAAHPPRPRRRWSAPRSWAGAHRPVRRCRPPSPPATRGRARRRTPTGRGSPTLYGTLAVLPSPVVELNRAVAVVDGVRPGGRPGAGRRARDEPALRDYHLLPSVRGDLLDKLGRRAEARAEFERAAR